MQELFRAWEDPDVLALAMTYAPAAATHAGMFDRTRLQRKNDCSHPYYIFG